MKPLRPRTAKVIAAEIYASSKRMENQRAEVTKAFMAKHGYEPDLCKQVRKNGEWCLIKIDPVEAKQMRRELVERLFYSRAPTKWQKFCLWLARLK